MRGGVRSVRIQRDLGSAARIARLQSSIPTNVDEVAVRRQLEEEAQQLAIQRWYKFLFDINAAPHLTHDAIRFIAQLNDLVRGRDPRAPAGHGRQPATLTWGGELFLPPTAAQVPLHRAPQFSIGAP